MSVRITGDRRVRQLLSEMADRTEVIPSRVWAAVGDVVAEHMADQFTSEGTHLTGKPWAPLKPPYLAWKIRRGFRPERLRQTDQMMLSLTSRPMAREFYRNQSATFGTDDPKAGFHQHGTQFMPQRTIIETDVNPDFADDVNSVLARYIFEERLS